MSVRAGYFLALLICLSATSPGACTLRAWPPERIVESGQPVYGHRLQRKQDHGQHQQWRVSAKLWQEGEHKP
jgi:hypothetical protein